jgi:WD40 repeat protein
MAFNAKNKSLCVRYGSGKSRWSRIAKVMKAYFELVTLVALGTFGQLSVLKAQTTPDIVWRTNGHSEIVTSVGFAANGASVTSGSTDYDVKIWNSMEGSLIRTVSLPQEKVLCVALSPDGSYAVAGSDFGAVRMWSVETGVKIWGPGRLEDDFGRLIYSLAFSPDGSRLVAGGSDGLSGAMSQPGGEIFGVSFSSDGQWLAASSSDSAASLLRVSDGSVVRYFLGHFNIVYSVDFAPDGNTLLTTSADGTARLWRVSDGQGLRVYYGAGGHFGRFFGNGKSFFTLNRLDGVIRFWRVSDGTLLGSYTGLNPACLAVSSDGQHWAYGTTSGRVVLARLPLIVEIMRQDDQVILHWTGGAVFIAFNAETI